MEELVAKSAEILEEENLDINKKFAEYEGWDSLAGLSLIAMLDSDYHKTMKTKDILAFPSIEAFCVSVLG